MLDDDRVVTEFHHSDESFGAKTINSVSGTALLMNNMMGVGIPLLPTLFQQAGFVSPIVIMLVVALLSGLSASMLTESMKYVPGNRNFDDRIEYASLCKFYLGTGPYWLIQVFLNMSLLSVNIVSILLTVQVMDWTIVRVFTSTCGLVLLPVANKTVEGFQCISPVVGLCSHDNSPFGNAMVISIGFVVIIALIIPMGYFNLEDNIGIQVLATLIQTLILIQWVVAFFIHGFTISGENVTAFGTGVGQGSVLGQVILNYAFVMTVPSWCNEKKRSSNVNKVVWSSVGISTTFFLAVGILGALSFPNLRGEDILTALNQASNGSVITEVSVYLFPIIAVASSIPVFSIIIRYNLMENGLCNKFWANVWAVVLPWVLAVPLTAGNTIFNSVATYTSILFQIPINLIVPFWIYIMAMRRKAYLKPCYCEPGRCEHDEQPLLVNRDIDSVTPETEEERERELAAHPISDDQVVTHTHVMREDGHVQKVSLAAPRKRWSEEHPKCANCCFAAFVRWRDRPPISPLARFSVRHAWLARVLPTRFVAYIDQPSPPAAEHFALPKGVPVVVKQGLSLFLAVITIVILLISLGLAVWQSVDPDAAFDHSRPNGTSNNCT